MTDPITGAVTGIADAATGAVTGIADAATGAVTGMADAATGAVTGIADAATGAVTGMTDAATGALGTMTGTPTSDMTGMTSTPTSTMTGTPASDMGTMTGTPANAMAGAPLGATTGTAVANPAAAGGETGAGIYDGYDSQVMTLEQEATSESEQLATGAASGGAGDPLTAILGAGVGWLLDHVSFLREPLDALQGDPEAIQAQVDQLLQHATDLMTIANEHGEQMTEAQDWSGEAADAFHGSMDRLGGELASMSSVVEGTANITAVSGQMLVAVRDAVEEVITTLVSSLIAGAVVAMAWSAFTFGASVVAYIGVAVASAVATTVQNVAKVQELMSALERQGGRVAQLGDMSEEIATSMDRFAKAAGTGGAA